MCGLTDAHTHVWIERIAGTSSGSPVLDDYPAILNGLFEFRQAGGRTLIDCQPAGCGRDGRKLRDGQGL